MRVNIYTLLLVLCIIAPIWAAFKDFVIENEKDLQSSVVSNDEMIFEYYDSLYDEFYDAESYNAIGSKCHDSEDFSDSYNIFKGVGGNDIDVIGMPPYGGNIDDNVLKEIIRQMTKDPSVYHLKKHLGEGDNIESYVDYFENDQYCTYSD